jgi:hypothetical protein
MKKILILVCMFVLSFSFISCGKDGSGILDEYEVQINFYAPNPEYPTIVPVGQGATFSIIARKNGEVVDPSDVTISTSKDSTIGNLRIWNDSGSVNIQSDSTINKKYGEITGCKIGAMSGSGSFGFTATYKSATTDVTFSTN